MQTTLNYTSPSPVLILWPSLSLLSTTLDSVYSWLVSNRLSVNPSKTEYLLIGNPQQLKKIISSSISFCSTNISPTDSARNLGVFVYLCQLLLPYNPTRQLRSSDQHLLTVRNIKSSLGQRSFSFSAPSIWNSLPLPLRSCDSVSSFRKLLKTHLFPPELLIPSAPTWILD